MRTRIVWCGVNASDEVETRTISNSRFDCIVRCEDGRGLLKPRRFRLIPIPTKAEIAKKKRLAMKRLDRIGRNVY